MKTSELKKIVEDNKCRIEYILDWIDIYEKNIKIGYVSTKKYATFITSDILPKIIAQAILEYAYTPLEEREEEKKYYLRFPIGFNQILTYLGLSMRGYDCVGIDCSEVYQTQFTQKEINDMPFDTNFFIKEEVK